MTTWATVISTVTTRLRIMAGAEVAGVVGVVPHRGAERDHDDRGHADAR